MGLDMYLEQKVYIGRYEFDPEASIAGQDMTRGNRFNLDLTIDDKDYHFRSVQEIIFQFMYWRKANAIHHWFVKNVQDGVDDCEEHEVSNEKLRELYNTCVEARLK